nr:hypothetical protein [Tanacetum cinerariifolium]
MSHQVFLVAITVEDPMKLFNVNRWTKISIFPESLENSSNEIAVSNSNQEKEEPSQDSNILQLIEECCTEVSEEQKQSMEDTMLELVKICQEKEFLCIHDNNFRVVHKSSISFRDTSQISSIHAIAPILSTKEPEHSLSIGYEHLSITPETESDKVIKSNVENLLPIPSECEVTLEDKSKCDVPIFENSPVCDNHSDIFSDSKIDDDILVYDNDFEDIEYVEASLSDPEIVSVEEENGVEEENVVNQEEEEESLENSSNEIAVSNSNQEKEEPSQDSNILQLIEECCTEVSEEQKQSMEDTMLELVKICQEKEFLCIHDNEVKNVIEQLAEHGNRSIQSLQNFRVVHKSSISFRDTSQISSIHAIAPILSTKEHEHSLSIGYEHLSITPETESDKVIKSNVENLLPIPSECEVTLEDKSKCDVPIFENSPVCDNHYDIFSDSKIDDDILVYDNDFEDIEYVEASLSDPEIVSVEEENGVEEENVVNQEEEEENPSIPRPPPKLPDAKTDARKEIPVVMNDKDKFDEDYHFSCLIWYFLFSSQRVRILSLILDYSWKFLYDGSGDVKVFGSKELALLCGRMFLKESNKVEKYVGDLPDMIQGSVMVSKPKKLQDEIEFATEVVD